MTCSECEKMKEQLIYYRNKYNCARSNANMYRSRLKSMCESIGVKPFSRHQIKCADCGGGFTLKDPCVCKSARRLMDDPTAKAIAADALVECGLAVRLDKGEE